MTVVMSKVVSLVLTTPLVFLLHFADTTPVAEAIDTSLHDFPIMSEVDVAS